MVAGLIFKIKGTYSIRLLGGFYKEYPKLSLLMAIPLFSLVGIPPLSGFWAKLFLLEGGLSVGNYWLVGFILFGSFITLFIIAKVWAGVFWKDSIVLPIKKQVKYYHELKPLKRQAMIGSIIFLSALSLGIGFGAEFIIQVATRAADSLMNPQAYIEAVLGQTN
jgi:multicomponent Na+:H+ antiporter subunit D